MSFFDWMWIILAILLSIFILLVRVVKISADEIGAIYRIKQGFKLERHKITRRGWHITFLILDEFYRFSKQTQRTRFPPGRKEQIQRDDNVPLQLGEVRALRVTQQEFSVATYYRPEDPDNPTSPKKIVPYALLPEAERTSIARDSLSNSIVTEVMGFVEWNIGTDKDDEPSDESVYNFVENVVHMETAHERIEGTVRAALQDLLGPITHRHTTEVKSYIEEKVKERVEVQVGEEEDPVTKKKSEKPWGINISVVLIEEISPGVRISKALADQSAAVSTAQAVVTTAKGRADEIRLIADAEKEATERRADATAYEDKTTAAARAEAITSVGNAMANDDARFAAVLETTQDVVKEASFIIADTNGGLAATVAAIARGSLDAMSKPKK
jgi:regulator of protease activity HflC (stomatin/prohibitin superfamily)